VKESDSDDKDQIEEEETFSAKIVPVQPPRPRPMHIIPQ
jgi:hypothetical protein